MANLAELRASLRYPVSHIGDCAAMGTNRSVRFSRQAIIDFGANPAFSADKRRDYAQITVFMHQFSAARVFSGKTGLFT
jgi:hypothetical protein